MDPITLEGKTPGTELPRAITLEVVDDEVHVSVYPPESQNPRAGFTIRLTRDTFAKLKAWVGQVEAPNVLSRWDRLALANQLRILGKLDEERANPDGVEALECGYEAEYEALVDHIHDPGVSEEQCTEVREILSMFEALNDALQVGRTAPNVDDLAVRFRGFGGNEPNEVGLKNYAEFYCREGRGRFESLKIKHWHSGGPMLPGYRRQLAAWRASSDPHHLSTADVQRIAAALKG